MSNANDTLHQQAIEAALSSNWQKAIEINQKILNNEPDSVESLNRLGRAFFESGELKKSKESFQKSLTLDPYNQIATKFLKRIEMCKNHKKQPAQSSAVQIQSDLFIEEPGRTKLVSLLKVAEPHKLSLLWPGMIVELHIKNKIICVLDQNGEYLGVLPDDISRTLIRLMHGGNKYQALIKNVKVNGLTILIKETYRSVRFKNQPSFLDNLDATIAYSSDHIILPSEGEEETVVDGDEEESN